MLVPTDLSEMKHSLTIKTGIIALSNVIRMAGLLAINAILARILTRDAYGTYQQVWLVYATMFPVFMLGIPASLYYFLQHSDERERGSIMANSFLLLLFSGLVMTVLVAAGAGGIARLFGNQHLALPLRIFSAYSLFTVSTLWAEPFYISTNRHSVVLFVTAASTLGLVISVVPLAALGRPLSLVFLAIVCYSALRFAGLGMMLGRDRKLIGRSPDRSLTGRQLAYSVPVNASEIIGSVSKNVDKVMVSRFFSPSSYAIYANGAMEIPISALLVGSISSVIWPSLSRMHREKKTGSLLSVWLNTTDKTAFVVMPLFFFFLLYAPDFMVTLFSQKYLASATPFRVYMFILPLRIAQYAVLLLSMGAAKAVLFGAAGDFVVKFGLSLALIRPLGYVGPAVAAVCSTWLQVFYYLYIAKKILGVGFRKILPWGRLARTSIIGAIACGCSYPVRLSSLDPLHRLLVGILVFAAVYLLFFYWFARESMPTILSRRRDS